MSIGDINATLPPGSGTGGKVKDLDDSIRTLKTDIKESFVNFTPGSDVVTRSSVAINALGRTDVGQTVSVAADWNFTGTLTKDGTAVMVRSEADDAYEALIGSKGTAFNKNFASSGTTDEVARGDHSHGLDYCAVSILNGVFGSASQTALNLSALIGSSGPISVSGNRITNDATVTRQIKVTLSMSFSPSTNGSYIFVPRIGGANVSGAARTTQFASIGSESVNYMWVIDLPASQYVDIGFTAVGGIAFTNGVLLVEAIG